ncbi:hypothetical protein GCM10008983_05170 [Lentibacillus halophilus]|uniref:YppG-like protein n=1 Tax=Lentibacillus halophilus TaxID=295065 RepID=A0ABN0Z3J8_9BACI
MLRKDTPDHPSFQNPYPHSPVNTGYPPTPFDVYAKPKQPMMPDPYATNNHTPGQSSASENLFHYFQDDSGGMDIEKIMTTAGQATQTVRQLSPVVKEVHSLIKQMTINTDR